MLQEVLVAVAKRSEIKEVYLHVWTGNDDALSFYKKFGFEVGEKIEGYYAPRAVQPPDCFVLRKVVNVTSGGK